MEYESDGHFWLNDEAAAVRGHLTFSQDDGGGLRLEQILVGPGGELAFETVLGADLNTWHDPVDLVAASNEDDYYEEMEFVGLNPRHGLAEAYRGVLERRGQLESLRTTAPPLATSHVLQSGVAHRMDRIYASPEFTPLDGEYWYEKAIEAGSDHALHWIGFTG